MTRQELASQIRLHEKQTKWGCFWGLSVMGLWMLMAPILDHFYHLKDSKVLLNVWAGGECVLIFSFFMVLIVFASRHGVPCKHCGKRLFGIPGQIAVATGVCGYCGEKAFD